MRAKLRDDLMYVAIQDGVYLETGTASMEINGETAYGLIQRIAPHLDGSRTVEELTANLPPAPRRLVTDLVTMLVERGIARDLDREPPHRLAEWELARYQQAITFAEHAADAPLHRFESFRNSRVLLIGAGQGMLALVQTLFDLGLRSATLVETTESPADPAAYRRILDRCRADDPTVELDLRPELTAELTDPARLATLIGRYQAVLHCTDRLMAGRALRLNRAARDHHVPVLHALARGGSAWVGPTGGGAAGGCWECAVWSLHGTSRSGDTPLETDHPDLVPGYLTPPVGALVGAALGFGYFRQAVGAETVATNRMTHIDLASAVTSEHLLGVHPRCRSCQRSPQTGDLAAQVAVMAQRPRVDPETFATRVATLIDAELGPLLEIGTGRQSQMSVSCIEAGVADLAGTGSGPTTVTAIGGSRRQALSRAAVAAVELLADRAAQAVAATGPADRSQWWDPATGTSVTTRPTLVRVAAGFSWSEALGRAVLRLRQATATAPDPVGASGSALDLAGPRASATRLDPAGPGESPAARFDPTAPHEPLGAWLDRDHWPEPVRILADEMAVLGHDLRAWRDASTTPTVFVGTDSGWLAHASAPDRDTALEQAMQAAVASLTGRSPHGADVGPDLGAGDWDAWLDPLLRELADAGQRLLLRPLDHLPGVRDVLPFIVEATLAPRTRSIG